MDLADMPGAGLRGRTVVMQVALHRQRAPIRLQIEGNA
jgi:hypothetical protein